MYTQQTELSRLTFISYASPMVMLALLTLPIYLYLPSFYAEQMGLGMSAVGFILLIARLWDGIIDPIIGIASDRTHHPQRRKIWIALGCPLILLSSYFLLMPIGKVSAIYLLVWSILLYTGWSMVQVPLSALNNELSNVYHTRTRLSAWREAFGLVGALLALIIIGYISTSTHDHIAEKTLQAIAYAVFITLPISIILFLRFLHVPQTQIQETTWRLGLKILKENSQFQRLVSAYLLNGLANALPVATFLLFVSHIVDAEKYQGLFLLIYFLSGLIGIPFWTYLAKRYNSKSRVWCAAMIWSCLFFTLCFCMNQGDIFRYGLMCVLTGFALGADLVLPPSMQADVIDFDTTKTGTSRAGLYYGLWSLATKAATALAIGLAFPLLDYFNCAANSCASPRILITIYAFAPILLKCAAIALIHNFDSSKEKVSCVQDS